MQTLMKMLLFRTNKVFCQIIVRLYVDLHTLKARQATESLPRCVFEFSWQVKGYMLHVRNHFKPHLHERV